MAIFGFVLISILSPFAVRTAKAYYFQQCPSPIPNPWTGAINDFGWSGSFTTAGQDGIKVGYDGTTYTRMTFNGQGVLYLGSVPLIYVHYDNPANDQKDRLTPDLVTNCWKQTFNYNGIDVVEVVATYTWPSSVYQYQLWWKFSSNGRIDAYMTLYGPGLGSPTYGHTYDVRWRLDWDLGSASGDRAGYTNPTNTWNWPSQETAYTVANSYPNPSLDIRDCGVPMCYQGTLSQNENNPPPYTPTGCVTQWHSGEEELYSTKTPNYSCTDYVNSPPETLTDIVLWYYGEKRYDWCFSCGQTYTQETVWLKVI